jgi:hypothetical protein
MPIQLGEDRFENVRAVQVPVIRERFLIGTSRRYTLKKPCYDMNFRENRARHISRDILELEMSRDDLLWAIV